jgi:ubiquinone/menaquinone biosynthesis C-methylase UbiE
MAKLRKHANPETEYYEPMSTASDQDQVHREEILDQFTRQAVPFAARPEHSDAAIFARLREFAGVGPDDDMLDVACGPGLVGCSFAPAARHVTGVDLTPAMIERARELQRERGLKNLSWKVGDATALPFPDAAFSLVVTRYSFHHLLDPLAAMREMVRVCRPGGTVMVVDVALPPAKEAAYNRFEKLRDPSHVRALTEAEFTGLATEAGLRDVRTGFYRLATELEGLLSSSFPRPDDAEKLRTMLRADLGVDATGFEAWEEEGTIRFSFPTWMVAGRKP